jgi:hypothetical protein
MVITVNAHRAHEIGDDTNRSFGAINFRLYRKFIGGGRLTIDGVARAPAEISSRFNGGLGVSQCISHRLMLNDRMDAAASLRATKAPYDVKTAGLLSSVGERSGLKGHNCFVASEYSRLDAVFRSAGCIGKIVHRWVTYEQG